VSAAAAGFFKEPPEADGPSRPPLAATMEMFKTMAAQKFGGPA
jgi:hypothetical protein